MEYNYNQYLNKLYKTFVNSYLSVARRANKIKNYKDFVREFLRFVLRTAEYFPVTKTSFITSIHCSPYVSGLMLEVTQEQHGIENNARVLKYINDLNFSSSNISKFLDIRKSRTSNPALLQPQKTIFEFILMDIFSFRLF